VTRFLVDQMLIRLGRWLRLMGMDVANPKDEDDQELLKRAKRENRILITRDRRLRDACKTDGVECIFIKSTILQSQLKEMIGAGVKIELKPNRCTICNGLLVEAEFQQTCHPNQKTWKCEGCGKLYWQGSHWKRIEETLKMIQMN
jgi:uncharacterized protein with PIN domain